MSSKPKTPTVEKPDVANDLLSYVSGMEQALPTILSSEQTYRPQFTDLNLSDISQMLTGGEFGGILGLGAQAQAASQEQLNAARQGEAESMSALSGVVRGGIQSLLPEQAQMVEQATNAANQAYARSERPTWEQNRNADQASREGYAARGRLGDTSSIVSEVLGRESVMAANRNEAAQLGNQAASLSNMTYQQPGLAMLMGTPASSTMGSQYLNTGLSSVGAATPQLYDTGTALDIGAQYRANQAQASIAGTNAQAQYSAGIFGGLGSAVGGIGTAIASDRRLKEDIKEVGALPSGLKTYEYRYKGEPQKFVGVMADEVREVFPDAVSEQDGFLQVDYSKIS